MANPYRLALAIDGRPLLQLDPRRQTFWRRVALAASPDRQVERSGAKVGIDVDELHALRRQWVEHYAIHKTGPVCALCVAYRRAARELQAVIGGGKVVPDEWLEGQSEGA